MQRIPRAEVEQHSQIVKDAAEKLDPKLEVYTMGSYGRGAATCGDVPHPPSPPKPKPSLMYNSDRSDYNQTRCDSHRSNAPNDNPRQQPLVNPLPNPLSLPLTHPRRLKMARCIPSPTPQQPSPALRSLIRALERTWRGDDLFHWE